QDAERTRQVVVAGRAGEKPAPGYSAPMAVFARVVAGVDGAARGFGGPRPARPAARTGFGPFDWADVLIEKATTTRDKAASILDGRSDSSALVARGRPLHVLRTARAEHVQT